MTKEMNAFNVTVKETRKDLNPIEILKGNHNSTCNLVDIISVEILKSNDVILLKNIRQSLFVKYNFELLEEEANIEMRYIVNFIHNLSERIDQLENVTSSK